MRDPLVDPRKGDIIKQPGWLREYEIARVDDSVLFFGWDRGRLIPMSFCSLNNWARLMSGADVIKVAGEEDPENKAV